MENTPFARIKKPLTSDINVVPYIDVMMVLLVIFMVTAPLLTTGVEVNLPDAHAKAISEKQNLPIVISLKADGSLFISQDGKRDKKIDEVALVDALIAVQKTKPNTMVLVNADKTNPYGNVMLLMSSLEQAGIQQVGLLTKSPDK